MRAVLLTGEQQTSVVEFDEPTLLPGALIVEVLRCGVGGSDVESFLTGRLPAPAWFGHEWTGRVVAVADDVSGHFEGERVLGAAPPPCGGCRPCRSGLGSHCTVVLDMIVGADPLASNHGAFAERIRVDARRVHRVPEGIDEDVAALAEPAAVATHAVARASVAMGDIVVVVGAGTIGLLVAEIARLSGAAAVLAIDPHQGRRELACDLGADAALAPGTDVSRWLADKGHGLGADVAFDCAAGATSLVTASASIRRGGTVVAVGVRQSKNVMTAPDLLEREADLRAALGYQVADVQRALDLMVDDRLKVGPIIDPEPVTLSGLDGVLRELAAGGRDRRKRLVFPAL